MLREAQADLTLSKMFVRSNKEDASIVFAATYATARAVAVQNSDVRGKKCFKIRQDLSVSKLIRHF